MSRSCRRFRPRPPRRLRFGLESRPSRGGFLLLVKAPGRSASWADQGAGGNALRRRLNRKPEMACAALFDVNPVAHTFDLRILANGI
jgi:hypothetical protein